MTSLNPVLSRSPTYCMNYDHLLVMLEHQTRSACVSVSFTTLEDSVSTNPHQSNNNLWFGFGSVSSHLFCKIYCQVQSMCVATTRVNVQLVGQSSLTTFFSMVGMFAYAVSWKSFGYIFNYFQYIFSNRIRTKKQLILKFLLYLIKKSIKMNVLCSFMLRNEFLFTVIICAPS